MKIGLPMAALLGAVLTTTEALAADPPKTLAETLARHELAVKNIDRRGADGAYLVPDEAAQEIKRDLCRALSRRVPCDPKKVGIGVDGAGDGFSGGIVALMPERFGTEEKSTTKTVYYIDRKERVIILKPNSGIVTSALVGPPGQEEVVTIMAGNEKGKFLAYLGTELLSEPVYKNIGGLVPDGPHEGKPLKLRWFTLKLPDGREVEYTEGCIEVAPKKMDCNEKMDGKPIRPRLP
jgi:hypothetical protein